MTIFEARQLTVKFGGVVAVSAVDLDVEAGEIRGIIGPNGAGKTTLLNLLTGIHPPTSGDILLNGKSIIGLKASAVAAHGVRRTFQSSQLFGGLTVLENVMTGYHSHLVTGPFAAAFGTARARQDEEEATAQAWEALRFVGMEQFADRDGAKLSFGQQRMVEIARAIVGRPKVLLLDEPAVGLSLDRVHDLETLIKRIRDERGMAVLMIEHVIRLIISLCDRVTVMASGSKIAEGTADEVTSNEKVIEAYLGRSRHAVS